MHGCSSLKADPFAQALELYSLVSREKHYIGAPAGSTRGVLETVRSFIEERTGLASRLHEFRINAWRLRSLTVEPKPPWASTAPYVLSSDVEGPVEVLEGDPSHPSSWLRGRFEDRIVVARTPRVVDDLKAAALLAAERGARALLVESPRPRIIVTGGDWGYSLRSGSPTPLPVVVVPEGFGARASRVGWARVAVEACVSESRDYNITVSEGGRGGLILVGAHYDHWYTGFNDNILGVAQALEAFQSLRREGKPVAITIFGAEEHGMPGTSSWYWAAGSREYAALLSASKAVEDVELYINFDMAGLNCLKASGAPHYALKLASLGAEWRCCECPECDSIMMAWAGVPTLSLHGLWCNDAAEIYHTPADTPDRASPATAKKALRLAVMAALGGADWRLLASHLREVLGSSGLRARKLLYIIEAMARRAGWGPLFRMMNQRLLSTIHYGSLRWESRELEAIYMPEAAIYTRLARDMERGSPPLEVVEVGPRERTLYSVAGSPRAPHTPFPSLALQHELLMKELEDRVEEIQRELIA